MRKLCKALEEDAFRPVLHHYDGPKFRLELSIPEVPYLVLLSLPLLSLSFSYPAIFSLSVILFPRLDKISLANLPGSQITEID